MGSAQQHDSSSPSMNAPTFRMKNARVESCNECSRGERWKAPVYTLQYLQHSSKERERHFHVSHGHITWFWVQDACWDKDPGTLPVAQHKYKQLEHMQGDVRAECERCQEEWTRDEHQEQPGVVCSNIDTFRTEVKVLWIFPYFLAMLFLHWSVPQG